MIDELNSKVKAMLDSAPGRKPSWDGERIRQVCWDRRLAAGGGWVGGWARHQCCSATSMRCCEPDAVTVLAPQMDKFCLEYEKRCVMWDDENNGFYMVRLAGEHDCKPLAGRQASVIATRCTASHGRWWGHPGQCWPPVGCASHHLLAPDPSPAFSCSLSTGTG